MFKKLITPILLLVIVNISFPRNHNFFLPKPDIIDTTNYAECVDIGIRIEVNKVYEERMTNLGAHPTYGTVFSTYGYVFPFSSYLPFNFKVSKNLLFEFRPGIRFAGEHLSSASLGLIFHYYPIEERVYVLLGTENSKYINPLTFNAGEECGTPITRE